jgi:ligand-binding sensor domain-containing protein/GGDEF domain-containing protein
MKRYIKLAFLAMLVFCGLLLPHKTALAAESGDANSYKRDYLSRIFNSNDGLDGTSANCICSDSEGFLWIGCYTGLYRYDGSEFKQHLIDGRALPITDILQSSDGDFWIGTNGDGLYRYDGENFTKYDAESEENGVNTIENLYLDSDGYLWVGTKAGLFTVNTVTDQVTKWKDFADMEISDVTELSSGEIVVIEKTGGVYLVKDKEVSSITINGWEGRSIPRCVCAAEDGYFLIGTDGKEILKVENSGQLVAVSYGAGLYSYNQISPISDGSYWVCSDSGIGLLKGNKLKAVDLSISDSIEETCTDYQGNYWFASSRMGIMELYKNDFSNLSNYWGLTDVVNSIQIEGDKTYVGTDNGLYCFQDGESVEDDLTLACGEERIRQIYKDSEGRIWISTYQAGILVQDTDGQIYVVDKTDSELTTDRIRSVSEMSDGRILIGTEEGIFICERDTQIRKLVEDEVVGEKRIMDVREASDGKIYVATDGFGVYVIENGEVTANYTKDDGLFSGSVMKVVPSSQLNGCWIVMGEGICFLHSNGTIHKVENIPAANCLDMMLTDNGLALIIASNGLFKVEEKAFLPNLLSEDSSIEYTQYDKKSGLPIDFTANSWSTLDGNVLYLCGTTGAASIDISKEREASQIRLYADKVTADGEEVSYSDGNMIIPASTHRLTISIHAINYLASRVSVGYYLEGVDGKELTVDGQADMDINYTNLQGGDYTCHYRVYDTDSGENLAEMTVNITKSYNFWEEPEIRTMLIFLGIILMILLVLLIFYLVERRTKKHYKEQRRREKEEEIARLAYNDLATGAYSRNYYEELAEQVDRKDIYAGFSVSVNYMGYYKSREGILFTEEMLRTGLQVLEESISEADVKIFRISDNVFFYWLTRPVLIEEYVLAIKQAFAEKGQEDKPFSFSVGGCYNDNDDTIRELLHRCEKMRMMDERLAESKFVEGKIKSL